MSDAENDGVIDEVLPEPAGGAQTDWEGAAATLREAMCRHLAALEGLAPDLLRRHRWDKFEAMGQWRVIQPAGGSASEPES